MLQLRSRLALDMTTQSLRCDYPSFRVHCDTTTQCQVTQIDVLALAIALRPRPPNKPPNNKVRNAQPPHMVDPLSTCTKTSLEMGVATHLLI